MASFNFIGVPGGSSGSGSPYSLLSTQLQIKENQLSADGNLSPGDYDLLTQMARQAYANPGLSAAERNQLAVKISGYQSSKSSSSQSNSSDVTRLNAGLKDDMATATMLRGNDPAAFIKSNADALSAKLGQLKDAIDTADAAGNDSSVLTNEFASTLSQYNDMTNALQDVNNYSAAAPGGTPTSNYAAYITTNPKGEITDVQIGRVGSITGYSQVKAVYGGLPIYGKDNTNQNGTKTFKLGNQTFSGSSAAAIDPTTLLPTAAGILTAPNQGDAYLPMDPSTQPQGFIPDQGWAQGVSTSTFYHNDGGGKYTKYVNASQKGLQIPDGGYISLPSSMESSIAPAVGTTTDVSVPLAGPVPAAQQPGTTVTPGFNPPTPTGGPTTSQQPPTPSVSRTQAPVTRSPGAVGGIAGAALNSAGTFLSNLFGKGSSQ